MEPALVREVFQSFVKIRYWDNGKFDFDGMNRMVEGMRIVGQLDKPVDWSTVVDQSFLPKDLQASLR
jgi:NitT/TauT family transport system substrate-binding protein